MKRLKLNKKVFINGRIIAKSGLHIGDSSLGLSIGGADKVVIRNPVTNLPYIPGSSLKGKLRSLLEKSLGLVKIDSKEEGGKLVWLGYRCQDTQEPLVQLFGYPADAGGVGEALNAPTRLTVRDGDLLNEAKLSEAENTDMYCTEVKTEVAIDRLTSTANPRNFERVSAGAEFKLELVLDLYDIDVEKNTDKTNGSARSDEFIYLLKHGLELLQDDYLGGQGTRGYGAVDIMVDSVEEKTAEAYRHGTGRTTSPYESIFSEFKCV